MTFKTHKKITGFQNCYVEFNKTFYKIKNNTYYISQLRMYETFILNKQRTLYLYGNVIDTYQLCQALLCILYISLYLVNWIHLETS